MRMFFRKNGGTPKSSMLIGCSLINPACWGTPIFENRRLRLKLHQGPWLTMQHWPSYWYHRCWVKNLYVLQKCLSIVSCNIYIYNYLVNDNVSRHNRSSIINLDMIYLEIYWDIITYTKYNFSSIPWWGFSSLSKGPAIEACWEV